MAEIKEEQIKKIAHAVNEAMKKEDLDDPLTKEKIERMVQDQIKLAEQRRTETEFDTDGDDEAVQKGGRVLANKKMLMSEKTLKRYHNDDDVQRIIEFQNLNDDAYIAGMLLAARDRAPYVSTLKELQIYKNLQDRLKLDTSLSKALSTGASSYGAEWIPTGFSSQLVEAVRLQLKVTSLFPSINMPTNPYTVPVQSGKATGYKIPESTEDDSTKIKATDAETGNFTFNATKFGARMVYSDEVDEDSIIAMMDFTKNEMATALAEAQENSVINGDDSTTHQDSNITSGYSAAKAYKGLRYYALNNAGTASSDFGNAVMNLSKLRSLRMLALKYGVNPNNNVWICSVNGYIQMLNINEVLTADKWPSGFTAGSGMLATLDGSPIVVSEWMYDNLNASGVYDGSTTDRTSILYVYKPGFWIGNRGAVTLKVTEDIETDQFILVGKVRRAFEDPYDATLAANPQAVIGYNIST